MSVTICWKYVKSDLSVKTEPKCRDHCESLAVSQNSNCAVLLDFITLQKDSLFILV